MKKLKVFFVVFFAAIMLGIGTGVVTVQAYKVPEPNYLAIGVSMLIQNRNSAVVNPLDSETIARIENGSLTLQEIDELKSTLQDSINQGFEKWQMQHFRELGYRGKPDNETVRSMLFSFLEQNPKYREQFKLYDQLLSLEIEQKIENITRQVHESFKNIDLIIEQGQLVSEWNITITINGENYTAINKMYELEINGTTQTMTKVSIYSPNGTEITDPYIYLIINPLVYWAKMWIWTWFPFAGYWLWYPVTYGYDCLAYARYPNNVGDPSEAWVYVNCLYLDQWMEAQSWKKIVTALGLIGGIFLAGVAIALTAGWAAFAAEAIIAASVAAVEATAGRAVDDVFLATWNTLLSVYAYNNEHDPTWGVETMQRFHYVVTPQTWDLISFMTYHFAYYNGATIQVVPLPGLVAIIDPSSANICWLALLEWTNVYPQDTWVWIGPLNVTE